MAQRSFAEVAAGAVVLLIAAGFLAYAVTNSGQTGVSGITLHAEFENIGGIAKGSDVRIAGMKIGNITDLTIDPKTYEAKATFTVQSDIKLPDDSSASIATGGLLGGNFLSLSPGGSEKILTNGGIITVTQSAVNLEDLLGKFIFNVGALADASQKQLLRDQGKNP
jgi:phospholipid/cholesterol/gamma-HCH transport system substrate-binding protein